MRFPARSSFTNGRLNAWASSWNTVGNLQNNANDRNRSDAGNAITLPNGNVLREY